MYDDFECVNLRWPLAFAVISRRGYQDVSLAYHLCKTAELALCLFNNDFVDLDVLSRRAGVEKGTLIKVLALSAGLHDIGKASRHYMKSIYCEQEDFCKLTFPYHEFLSALILYASSWPRLSTVDREVGCIFRTSAKVVSRHHSSMTARHPSDYANRRLIEGVAKAARALNGSDVRKVLEQLKHTCGMQVVSDELNTIRSMIENVISYFKSTSESNLENNIKSMIRAIAMLNLNPGDACDGMNELVVVRTITGFLIVADNIVANRERRNVEDSPIPAYIESWNRELNHRLENCKTVLESL
ncbi:MAG: CRISPR-associated endonuclease Cas3'' [Desulfurococcaceae archaeon]